MSQHKYLSYDHDAMHAVVAVGASGLGAAARDTRAAEVIVIDCSGSMGWPHTKIAAARQATAAAVQLLRDGTRFAIVEGTDQARWCIRRWPDGGGGPRLAGGRGAFGGRLVAVGGTAMGAWLELAGRLFAAHPAPLRHVTLLTDGRNEDDPPGRLERVLEASAGAFTCDARGIGEDWDPAELKLITGRLHGTADAVLDTSDLTEEFRTVLGRAMATALPDLRLRVRLRIGSEIRYLKQVHPVERDLTAEGVATGERTWEFPTRAWRDETRDFHLCVSADPAGDTGGEDAQLAVVDLVPGDGPLPPARCPGARGAGAVDGRPGAVHPRPPKLAHYDGQRELGRAVGDGCDAYDAHDHAAARAHWSRAVALAHALGDVRTLARLARLVEIVNAATGEVRVRADIRPVEVNAAHLVTEHSVRWPGDANPAADPGPADHAPDAPAGDPAGDPNGAHGPDGAYGPGDPDRAGGAYGGLAGDGGPGAYPRVLRLRAPVPGPAPVLPAVRQAQSGPAEPTGPDAPGVPVNSAAPTGPWRDREHRTGPGPGQGPGRETGRGRARAGPGSGARRPAALARALTGDPGAAPAGSCCTG
ncbi:VWA domain-containing protein [Streptomyces sp. M19]